MYVLINMKFDCFIKIYFVLNTDMQIQLMLDLFVFLFKFL